MRMTTSFHLAYVALTTCITPCITKWARLSTIRRMGSATSTFRLRSTVEDEKVAMTRNFITNIIEDDLKEQKNGGRVLTRFPPEPNGYLHLGHAKSVLLNFGIAQVYGGKTNMRFDDTNPEKENMEFINSILRDVKWLVNDENGDIPWDGEIRHASDYFESIYQAAVYLIKNDLAYVDNLSQEEMRQYRGTLTEPGKPSPYRNRTIEENLQLFEDMRAGKFPDGHCVLRAKIDMNSPNMNMRDPTLYRIKNAPHPITGNKWCIYPMYDFAHALSDALEGITHSLCTLEFADHRPLYDWSIDKVLPSGLLPYQQQHENWRPKQIEFSRLNLQYTVLSKRKLIELVTKQHVTGWDDPRMPTITGLRRRGYPSKAIKLFCERIGISRAEGTIDIEVFEETMREYLDDESPRIFAVINPLKVTITNYDINKSEVFSIENHPRKSEYGHRNIHFTNSLYIDRADFHDIGVNKDITPPKGYKRLLLDTTVRLKYGYVIHCHEVKRDPGTNEVIELLCTCDPETSQGRNSLILKKPKGIIQWISQHVAVPIQLNVYDRLFITPNPGKDQPDGDFLKDINPNSKTVIKDAYIEPAIYDWKYGTVFQFERLGYYYLDPVSNHKQRYDSIIKPTTSSTTTTTATTTETPVLEFNRVVSLKDTWQQVLANKDAAAATASDPVARESLSTTSKTTATTAAASTGGKNGSNNNQVSAAAAVALPDYDKLDIRIGKILSVEKHPDADSLYVLKVDLGESPEKEPRTIVSGLVKYFTSEELLNQEITVLCNLKPSKLRGIMSEGMVLTAVQCRIEEIEGKKVTITEKVELIQPSVSTTPGTRVLLTEQMKGTLAPVTTVLSKDVWTRISQKLKINDNKEFYYDQDGSTYQVGTSGNLIAKTLSNVVVQ